jgi:uncharacterized protein YndB with AHSA1/START domain
MEKGFTAEASIHINASPAQVWEALTNPEMIKQYFFGTTVESDWEEGSPITYRGEWEGKQYEDKGTILKLEPKKYMRSTYWSSMSGITDEPENYATVDYILIPEKEGTTLTVRQDNNKTEASKAHSESNWKMVLEGLKKLLENN